MGIAQGLRWPDFLLRLILRSSGFVHFRLKTLGRETGMGRNSAKISQRSEIRLPLCGWFQNLKFVIVDKLRKLLACAVRYRLVTALRRSTLCFIARRALRVATQSISRCTWS